MTGGPGRFERFADKRLICNAQMGAREIRSHCTLDYAIQRLLEDAVERLTLSARAYGRILKTARTIADLAGEERLRAAHVAEALQYRAFDRIP